VPDLDNGLCYRVLQNVTGDFVGNEQCGTDFNASILAFEYDNQVTSFYNLLSSGKKTDSICIKAQNGQKILLNFILLQGSILQKRKLCNKHL